ncbi:CRISPR-associated endonuclease Cas2 [[Limnothrix rosea] IAM M-220]|uniref:CRISPR-associated endonuclease Cas2 n=1 Tax=[Limnothrix rosea] IAM M-220 TaxID=454133 RepID=UPI00095C1E61|nr:CRISPR-associated endonuclease Cas2 [[Limnothrix rosea] IAM M-220]OKH15961.1 CRISPR-associated endonuclease Cas2 [[Limnothrix rosea] IAM M-220]
MFYLVAYDISDNKRRKKIADLLEGYGCRVQFSVFECRLSVKKYGELKQRLRRYYREEEQDSLRFYPISGHTLGQVEIWGEPPLLMPPSSTIV